MDFRGIFVDKEIFLCYAYSEVIILHVKNILIIIEIIIAVLFIIPVFSNILNPGNIAGILVSVLLLAVTIFHKSFFRLISGLWSHTGGKVLIIAAGIVIAAALIYVTTLTAFMVAARSDKPEAPDAVIVLGCKVNGEKPSRMLRRRLDSAAEYLSENEAVVCIVSGGKGSDEAISEAKAMKVYLTEHGISADRIIMEERSVNTYENLKNSTDILGKDSGEIAIVTDGFHQYRAGYIAEKLGYDASAINARTDINSLSLDSTYYVREWMAITNEYLKSLH